MTWLRLLAIGGSAVLAVALISVLDWFRGPDRWTHLGNFVQRIIDGDALDVISCKAVASADTLCLHRRSRSAADRCRVLIAIFRHVVPRISPDFTTVRSALIATLIVAIVGTVLNDGGIFVWLTVTAQTIAVIGWFFPDWAERNDWTSAPSGRAPAALRPWQTLGRERGPEPQSGHSHGLKPTG